LFLSLACCSGGTLTSEMVHLLSPTEYKCILWPNVQYIFIFSSIYIIDHG
jgi:hypothetical protein